MRAERSAVEKSGSPGGWVGVVTGRISAWIMLVAVLLVSGAVFAFASSESSSEAPQTLPDDSEAALVSEIQREFPDSGSVPAVLVVTREDGGELGPEGVAAAVGAGERMSEVVGTPPQGPIQSEDGAAALVLVPVDASLISGGEGRELVEEMRGAVAEGLDDGLSAQLTGGPAFAADTAAAFEGADFRLLAATALVVAVLLIITYRSPVLWLVPLLIIGVADRVAALLVSLVGEAAGVTVDASTSGIVSVLVFGAGTNYALLLVSRYREELRRTRDRRTALRDAYRGAVPAILASNITVVLALLTLLLATLPNYRSLGLSAAVGLLVALVYALIALPAALAVCGRGLFWPFIPRPGQHHGRHEAGSGPATPEGFDEEVPPGVWGRIAARVVKRPVTVLVSCVLLLAVLALGLIGTRVGLSQTEQFRTASESAAGLETAAEHFPAGVTDPVTVLTRTGTEAGVAEAAQGVEGVVSARPAGESGTGWSRVTVVLDAAPATDRSEDSVVALREAVDTVPGSGALVGGSVAEAVDTSEGNIRDLTLIAPLILLVVFVVLILVLRSLVAPLLVLTATALSSVAALGLGTFVTTQILGFPGLDVAVPLYSFLFLVALGVDYSIFLTIRAREEAGTHATREAMVRAVALTGGVITSAGIVLASVFVVLGVLPLIVLTQVGVIVALGVLLDTFIVRTLVVPALFTLVGDRVWWPGDPRRGHRRAAGADRTADGTGTVGPDSGGSHPDTPRRPGSRLRGLVTALAVAPLLAAGLGAAPAAGAQDLTDGGRLGGGASQLLPDGVALGSLGGPELTQVGSVDLERYAGEWFQVAAIPQPYTLQCTNDTRAEYAVTAPGTVSVRNSCGSAISSDSVIEGEAKVRDTATNASLRVNFPMVPFQDEAGPVNYRITYLADDYSLAIVGDPTRSSGFVLSREPALDAGQWATVRDVIEDRGWWSCAFLTVPMAGGRGDATPLCLLP